MKKILFTILLMVAGLSVNAKIRNNFMEAGKFAYSDQNYPLALYFYEGALRQLPADSVVDMYIVNCRLRDAYMYSRNYEEGFQYGNDAISTKLTITNFANK